jgi:hypothetical protein
MLPAPATKTDYQRFWEEADPTEMRCAIEGEDAYDIATLALYEQATDRAIADWTDFDEVLTTGKKGGLFGF